MKAVPIIPLSDPASYILAFCLWICLLRASHIKSTECELWSVILWFSREFWVHLYYTAQQYLLTYGHITFCCGHSTAQLLLWPLWLILGVAVLACNPSAAEAKTGHYTAVLLLTKKEKCPTSAPQMVSLTVIESTVLIWWTLHHFIITALLLNSKLCVYNTCSFLISYDWKLLSLSMCVFSFWFWF